MNKIEIEHLRSLAVEVKRLSELPIMEERKKLWLKHNRGESTTPIVLMEHEPFMNELSPELRCGSELGKNIERQLLNVIVNHCQIGDDKIVVPQILIPYYIDFNLFNIKVNKNHADGGIGYQIDYPLNDLTVDLSNLQQSTYFYDQEKSELEFAETQDVLGDILEIKFENYSLKWLGISERAVYLLGMENLFLAMMETPESVDNFLSEIADEFSLFIAWQEKNNLLTLNNSWNYAGSGSYGLSDQLPQRDFQGKVRAIDIWGNLNSQETVGVAPQQFMSLFYPHYQKMAKQFGLIYYGCCEGVHDFWQAGLCNLPNVRKVSISPWCSEEIMGKALAGSGICYCRKVSPNFIGIDKFDCDGLKKSIKKTLRMAAGCSIEFSFRDIYTLCGDANRAKEAVAIVRDIIEKNY